MREDARIRQSSGGVVCMPEKRHRISEVQYRGSAVHLQQAVQQYLNSVVSRLWDDRDG